MTASAGWPSDDPRLAEILGIIAQETGVTLDRLQPGAAITSLDIASLDLVQAIFAIETRFKVELPVMGDSETGEFATIGELVHHALAVIEREAPV